MLVFIKMGLRNVYYSVVERISEVFSDDGRVLREIKEDVEGFERPSSVRFAYFPDELADAAERVNEYEGRGICSGCFGRHFRI